MDKETAQAIIDEFTEWHTRTSMRNWGRFPKNLWENAKIAGGTWYWKGHSIPELYYLIRRYGTQWETTAPAQMHDAVRQ